MKRANRIKSQTSFFAEVAGRLNGVYRALVGIFSFSLADERIAARTCVAVHLDSGGISLAYGSRFLSRVKIAGTRHIPGEEGKYPSPDVLASSVHLALNELHALEADVTLIVPKAWTIVKTADFPLVVKGNLSDVVVYEFDRLTPLSAEKAYYDYQIIGEDKKRMQIILAAVKAEILDPYLQAFRQRRIRLERVISSLSAIGSLSHAVGGEPTIFVDDRSGLYEGGLIDRGRLAAYFRVQSASGGEPEKTTRIAAEINPLIEAWREEGRTPTVVVNAASGVWPSLSGAIAAPVFLLRERAVKFQLLRGGSTILYTAVGGVMESLQTKFRGINILTRGIHTPSRTPIAATVFLLAVLAGLGVFSLVGSLQMETKRVEAVEREITTRTAEIKQIETLKIAAAALEKEIGTIDRFKVSRPMVVDLLKELTQILPKNAWLTRVRTTDTSVNIEGYAESATGIVSKLEASPYFKKVEFASPTFRDGRMKAERFVFKMEIEGQAEEKGRDEKK